jgi:hypothetical protein
MVLEDAKLKGSEISFTVAIPPVSGNGPDYTGRFAGSSVCGSLDPAVTASVEEIVT